MSHHHSSTCWICTFHWCESTCWLSASHESVRQHANSTYCPRWCWPPLSQHSIHALRHSLYFRDDVTEVTPGDKGVTYIQVRVINWLDLYPCQSDWLTRDGTCDWPPGGRWRNFWGDVTQGRWLIDLTYIQVDWHVTETALTCKWYKNCTDYDKGAWLVLSTNQRPGFC